MILVATFSIQAVFCFYPEDQDPIVIEKFEIIPAI